MKAYGFFAILFMIYFSFSGAMAQVSESDAKAQTNISEEKCIELSKTALNHLLEGEYEDVYAMFDEKVKASLNTEQLKQVWEGLSQRLGVFQESKGITTEESQGYLVVTNNLEFENSTVGLRLAYNENSQISGFFFVPAK